MLGPTYAGDETMMIPVTDDEFIVASICILTDRYAVVDSVRRIGKELRAEQNLSSAGVYQYLQRLEREVRSVEPGLVPAIEDIYRKIALAAQATHQDSGVLPS